MDFGAVSVDGLVVGSELCNSSSGFASLGCSSSGSDPETKQKWYGSRLFRKQERSGTTEDWDDWRSSKLSKTDHGQQQQQQQQQQQMLSFSCPKSDASSKNAAALPSFDLTSASPYNRNTGYNSGIFNSGNTHGGVLTETRGPFTPSQWIELEHQALIYKYITANVPIPSNLLIPIRKAIESAGFSCFPGGLLRPNTLGWGTFHPGFSSNTDPEPGRCRRTDGKKWRCSRDAVADQKYCERHMNRGRHRSRKPVEGQSGQSAATSMTTNPKPVSTISSSSTSASLVGPRAGSLAIAQQQQQFKNLQAASSSNLSAATSLNSMFLNRENVTERAQDTPALSMLSSNNGLKSEDSPFLISKQHKSYEGSSRTEFGLVTSGSLLNPSQKSSPLMSCRNFGSSQDLIDHETVSQHSLRQFMDDWPKSQSDQTAVSWPDLEARSDGTQLSISIHTAPTDFMSSTSSPNNEKTTLSPLRLSCEVDLVQMALGVGQILDEPNQRQANWIPISWENSMGGPLGEVLQNTNNSAAECKNSSALNLMTEGWDSSLRLASSPTGVLQKAAFGSLSNSSAGSSPRAENNKTSEGASLYNSLLAQL